MNTVSIQKTEYQRLRRHAAAYRKMAERVYESVLRDPIKEVAEDFRRTGLYTDEFIVDLESGLRNSSYAR